MHNVLFLLKKYKNRPVLGGKELQTLFPPANPRWNSL